jgi:hypothetical protein
MRLRERAVNRWRRVVEEFQTSGLSRKQFCEVRKIKGHSLDYWRARFRSEGRSPTTSPTEWIPVRLTEEAKTERCSISLRVGRVEIEVKHGFDARLLAEVLRVVNPPC